MAENNKKNSVEEQRARQRELIELKRQKEAFAEDPDNYTAEQSDTAYVQSRRSKIENFWYYSKFAIGFAVIVILILAVGITQCATRTDYDMTIVLYFKNYADSAMSENLATVAEQYCEDLNGDGKVEVLVVNCAIPDATRLADGDGTNRLLGQFQNEEAITYIVDTGAFNDLKESFGNDFLYYGMNLPDLNGAGLKLNGSVFDAAFDTVSDNYTDTFDYYLIRRNVGENSTANKKGVEKHIRNSENFIEAVKNDPYLNGRE